MRVLFKEIRSGDIAAVAARLDKNPELVNDIASAPPKKDDGQSALQVAIKSAHAEIAMLLIERGADIHFRETSAINAWNMPVLHHAVMASVLSSRFARNYAPPGRPPDMEILSTAEDFETWFAVLDTLLSGGADPAQLDSYGNSALKRAVLDARQIIEDPPLLPELAIDLHRVFDRLLAAGADPHQIDPTCSGEPVLEFLRVNQ